MAAARISHTGSASSSQACEDYSLYSNLSDEELLQLAIERSLTDTHSNTAAEPVTPPHPPDTSLKPAARNTNQPSHSSHNPPVNYSSPNPPREKPPDPYVTVFLSAHRHEGNLNILVQILQKDCWWSVTPLVGHPGP